MSTDPRSRRTAQTLAPFMGTDLGLRYRIGGGSFEDADLVTARRPGARVGDIDLDRVSGIDNLTQAIANRLKTRKGELAPLGEPDYGSRHHQLVGEPNLPRVRNLIKLYVLQALGDEPRIEKVLSATVAAEHDPPRDSVRIVLSLQVLGQADPLNLVLPFALGGAP
jgi:phage baseplate assembly protein W